MSKVYKLGPFKSSDLKTIFAWQNTVVDKRTTMGFRFPVSDETASLWLQKRIEPLSKNPTEIYWALREESTDDLIGYVTLFKIDYINRNAEIGIYLNANRNTGIGSNAIRDCLILGYKDLNLKKIQAVVIGNNIGAVKVFTKNQFEQEGLFKNHYWDGENWQSLLILAHFA